MKIISKHCFCKQWIISKHKHIKYLVLQKKIRLTVYDTIIVQKAYTQKHKIKNKTYYFVFYFVFRLQKVA